MLVYQRVKRQESDRGYERTLQKSKNWRFPKMAVPQNGSLMENPIRMDDLGVPPFQEMPIWINDLV